MQAFQYKLLQKLNDTFSLPPNDLDVNFLTLWYKKSTTYLKNLPFIYIIPLSFIITFLLYLMIGSLVIKLTTLLQYGF